MRLLLFFLVVLSIKFTTNLSKLIQAKRYLKRYKEYLPTKSWEALEDKPQIIKLLKGAGIKDSYLPHVEPVGYGRLVTTNISVFDNIFNTREDVVVNTLGMFHQAIGAYRSRVYETFNPLYWLEAGLNLPKHLSAYLGVSPESVLAKIAQLVWWVTLTLGSLLYALYRPEVETLVKAWISKAEH
jgi:hypothetical protein